MTKPKARGGRPPKAGGAMGAPLGLRLPSDLMEKIDKAAAERGWTRIEEIRRRLADSFSPLSNDATAMANVIGLHVEQIQQLTGRPLHADPFSWIALHSALRCLIPSEPEGATLPERLEPEARAMHGDEAGSKVSDFAGYIGLRVWSEIRRMLELIDNPAYSQNLSPERRAMLESIHQDFELHKLWANIPKSGFVAPKASATRRRPSKKEPSR